MALILVAPSFGEAWRQVLFDTSQVERLLVAISSCVNILYLGVAYAKARDGINKSHLYTWCVRNPSRGEYLACLLSNLFPPSLYK